MRWTRPVGVVGLCAALVAVGLLVRGYRKEGHGGAAASASGSATLGAPPPADVARNPEAAKRFVEQQDCLAGCATEGKTCEATAEDTAGERKCRADREACEARCR